MKGRALTKSATTGKVKVVGDAFKNVMQLVHLASYRRNKFTNELQKYSEIHLTHPYLHNTRRN